MSTDEPIKSQIRIPPALHARLTEAAARSGRSFNGEMVARLQESFPDTLASVMLTNRLEEMQIAQRDIDAEMLFLDTLVKTDAAPDLIAETVERVGLLRAKKNLLEVEILELNAELEPKAAAEKTGKSRRRSS